MLRRMTLKRNLMIILSVGFLLVSSFFVNTTHATDKGREYYEKTGKVVWEIQTTEKVVALTFDDGPHPIYTEQILNLMDQYGAKGTFFLVGEQAEKNSEVVLRMYEDGHEIANHTYTHPFTKSVPDIIKEMDQTNEVLYNITGYAPTLFRPVEGHYTDQLINEVANKGYKMVMWSWHQDTEDWRDPGVNHIVRKVLNGIGAGNIVLFHDGGSDRTQTVQALEIILPELKKQGYRFITVSEMLDIQKGTSKLGKQ